MGGSLNNKSVINRSAAVEWTAAKAFGGGGGGGGKTHFTFYWCQIFPLDSGVVKTQIFGMVKEFTLYELLISSQSNVMISLLKHLWLYYLFLKKR